MDRIANHVVARPTSIEQARKVVQTAIQNKTHLFVRGGGSGYFGGELATREGIILETTGLNWIHKIDTKAGTVVCGAGVTVAALNRSLGKKEFFWPHNPGSRQSATVGGSLSTLGVGTFSSKFGYASESVLGLKIVSPKGEVITTGSSSRHDMSSYNLLDLICSSEGTLGVIVEARLKIYPIPPFRKQNLYFFKDIEDAILATRAILNTGIYPESLEIEDLPRFLSEGLTPVLRSNDSILQTVRNLGSFVLFVGCAGARKIVEFESSEIDRIVKLHKGKPVNDRRITIPYWKSKTKISSWVPKEKRSKVQTFVPSLPLNKIPAFEKAYWNRAKKYRKLRPMGVGYYVILQNLECTASARMMFDDSQSEPCRQYENFVRDIAKEVAAKIGGSIASTFGVGTILGEISGEYTSPTWLSLSRAIRKMIDPLRMFSPDKKEGKRVP